MRSDRPTTSLIQGSLSELTRTTGDYIPREASLQAILFFLQIFPAGCAASLREPATRVAACMRERTRPLCRAHVYCPAATCSLAWYLPSRLSTRVAVSFSPFFPTNSSGSSCWVLTG